MTRKEEIIRRIENLTDKQFELLIALYKGEDKNDRKRTTDNA